MVPASVIAVALDWPYSGHVMWNVVFIGHVWMTGKRRTTWMSLFVASLVYLNVMKIFSQTTRDLVGSFIAMAVGGLIVAVVGPPTEGRDRA
jgi:hypothetical protein